jgi:chorismate mutase
MSELYTVNMGSDSEEIDVKLTPAQMIHRLQSNAADVDKTSELLIKFREENSLNVEEAAALLFPKITDAKKRYIYVTKIEAKQSIPFKTLAKVKKYLEAVRASAAELHETVAKLTADASETARKNEELMGTTSELLISFRASKSISEEDTAALIFPNIQATKARNYVRKIEAKEFVPLKTLQRVHEYLVANR